MWIFELYSLSVCVCIIVFVEALRTISVFRPKINIVNIRNGTSHDFKIIWQRIPLNKTNPENNAKNNAKEHDKNHQVRKKNRPSKNCNGKMRGKQDDGDVWKGKVSLLCSRLASSVLFYIKTSPPYSLFRLGRKQTPLCQLSDLWYWFWDYAYLWVYGCCYWPAESRRRPLKYEWNWSDLGGSQLSNHIVNRSLYY